MSNRLFPLHAQVTARFLLVLASVSACLIPQPDVVSPDLPPSANRPVIISRAIPTVLGAVKVGTCTQDEFSINVDDLDTDTEVRSLWFVDPQNDLSQSALIVPATKLILSANPDHTIRCPRSALAALANRFDGKTHRLTVFVSDSDFMGTSIETFRVRKEVQDGGVVLQEASRASYNWSVEVLPCP
jgi:hypothetical protein